jgi:hypothetical protein
MMVFGVVRAYPINHSQQRQLAQLHCNLRREVWGKHLVWFDQASFQIVLG